MPHARAAQARCLISAALVKEEQRYMLRDAADVVVPLRYADYRYYAPPLDAADIVDTPLRCRLLVNDNNCRFTLSLTRHYAIRHARQPLFRHFDIFAMPRCRRRYTHARLFFADVAAAQDGCR